MFAMFMYVRRKPARREMSVEGRSHGAFVLFKPPVRRRGGPVGNPGILHIPLDLHGVCMLHRSVHT